MGLCGISVPFGTLSPARGKVSYVLLTRTPRYRGRIPFAFDLHVLSPPLTFALSQDQTLQLYDWFPSQMLPPLARWPGEYRVLGYAAGFPASEPVARMSRMSRHVPIERTVTCEDP